MRNALIAVALLYAASARADQSVLTYHGALDRAGRYVVPGLTFDRARGLRLERLDSAKPCPKVRVSAA
jgi:hypothetical protein